MRLLTVKNILAGLMLMMASLMFLGVPQSHAQSDNNVSCQLASSNVFLSANIDYMKTFPLISSDVLLAQSRMLESQAQRVSMKHFDQLQHQLIQKFLAALIERQKAWRDQDEQLNVALAYMIAEFALMHRFYAPLDEFKLFYEKSIHIRMSNFRQTLLAGQLTQSTFMLPLMPGIDSPPGVMARLYSAENPLKLETKQGRIRALLILHLLRTDPALRILWDQYRNKAAAILTNSTRAWEQVETAAQDIPLGLSHDIHNQDHLQSFNRKLENGPLKIQTDKLGKEKQDAPLYLLPSRIPQVENLEPFGVSNAVTKSLQCKRYSISALQDQSSLKPKRYLFENEAYIELNSKLYADEANRLNNAYMANIDSAKGKEAQELGDLLQFIKILEDVSKLSPIENIKSTRVAIAPQSLKDYLNKYAAKRPNEICIVDFGGNPQAPTLKVGKGLWMEQAIEFTAASPALVNLDGNAMLEEETDEPAKPETLYLIAPRLTYRESASTLDIDESKLKWQAVGMKDPDSSISLPAQ